MTDEVAAIATISKPEGPYLANADFIHSCAQQYRTSVVNKVMSPNDTMNNQYYLEVGYSAVDCILRGLCAARTTHVGRILDLPCGHGRVLRHLAAMFPHAQIDACDLDEDGVAFCAQTFGANGIISNPDLTKAVLPGNYDLIWAGSLFTHVPRATTQQWLTYLATLLSPSGVVIATTHGRWCEHIYDRVQYISADKWQQIVADFHASGYGYASYARAESHDFIEHDYGISLASPHATIKDIETIPSIRIYSYMERAWADHQDVVVFGRPGFDTPWPAIIA